MHNSGLISLGHDLHAGMHSFRAPQHPADGLILGTFSRSAQDKNNRLWCVPLSMELMLGIDMFHLPCECITVDMQAWGMTCISGCIPFRPHSTNWIDWLWADLWLVLVRWI